MILYPENTFRVLTSIKGTVFSRIRKPYMRFAMLQVVCYVYSSWIGQPLGHVSVVEKIFGISTSFLLMFRANQAYARYWVGRTYVSNFFSDLRDFIMVITIFSGSEENHRFATSKWMTADGFNSQRLSRGFEDFDRDEPAGMAREFRIDVIRLCLALAVAFKMQTRIVLKGYGLGFVSGETKWLLDWDRFRMRQLLVSEEFLWVDEALGIEENELHMPGANLDVFVEQFRDLGRGIEEPPADWPAVWSVNKEPAMRPSVVLVFLLRELLIMNMNDNSNSKSHGLRERLIPMLWGLLQQLQDSLEMSMQIISTPLPFPLKCLCKTMLFLYLMHIPATMDASLGLFGAVAVPLLIALATLGIDAISAELENPFGDDPNDLDLIEALHSFEGEAMEMLILAGDNRGRAGFVWRRMPAFVTKGCIKPVDRQLVMAELAADEVVPTPR